MIVILIAVVSVVVSVTLAELPFGSFSSVRFLLLLFWITRPNGKHARATPLFFVLVVFGNRAGFVFIQDDDFVPIPTTKSRVFLKHFRWLVEIEKILFYPKFQPLSCNKILTFHRLI